MVLAERKLTQEGQLFAELNATYASEIATLFQKANFEVALKKDMQGKDRMLRAWRWPAYSIRATTLALSFLANNIIWYTSP